MFFTFTTSGMTRTINIGAIDELIHPDASQGREEYRLYIRGVSTPYKLSQEDGERLLSMLAQIKTADD